ncbi:8-oxo-dGTP diphosphatase MutT [Brassicibacter mesophilus]|uniref:8-oxo-dGTP diphosphatase MutT n=1 Tax=Brassicibacter mesophilus TaxID=745119 RepID=UPI003D1EB7B5
MLDVVAAILMNSNSEIMIAKRKADKSLGGYWEFPGGKVEYGETPEESLKRELREEMCIDIKVKDYFGENIYKYDDKTIRLIAYICEIVKGDIMLIDHSEYRWVDKKLINYYNIAPADIFFVKKLQSIFE